LSGLQKGAARRFSSIGYLNMAMFPARPTGIGLLPGVNHDFRRDATLASVLPLEAFMVRLPTAHKDGYGILEGAVGKRYATLSVAIEVVEVRAHFSLTETLQSTSASDARRRESGTQTRRKS
jgi:hypothetical protein